MLAAALRADPDRPTVTVFVVLLLAACGGRARCWRKCGGDSSSDARSPVGTGADRAWVLRPEGTPKSVVVFVHGLGGPQEIHPTNHLPWLRHLVEQGNAVIYPAYESQPGGTRAVAHILAGSRTGCASSATRRFRLRASATRGAGASSSSGPRCSGRRHARC